MNSDIVHAFFEKVQVKMFVEYNRFEEIFSPFPIIPLKRSLQQKLNHFMDRFLTIFVGNMKVHTRKLDGICFSSSYVSAVILPFVSQNIQMFFVIQHELIVQGKHVVRSDHRVLGTLNR